MEIAISRQLSASYSDKEKKLNRRFTPIIADAKKAKRMAHSVKSYQLSAVSFQLRSVEC